MLQRKLQLAIKHPKNTIFPFQTDKVLRESLHMFDTQNNESMNNVITYVVPKNKTMEHIMGLKNRISCVVVTSIFGFKKYWHKVFNLMELNMSPSSKQLFQSEIFNANKNKSYYQHMM